MTSSEMANTALVLIDLQNDVVNREGSPATFKEAALVSTNLATWARSHGVPVILVGVLRRADGSDWPRNTLQPGKPQDALFIEGSRGAEFFEGLATDPSDYIVHKRRMSAFCGTRLDLLLRSLGVRHLLIGGIATNWGVENTVRDAWDLDYEVTVISDCCASFSEQDHRHSLDRVFSRRSRVVPASTISGASE